MTKPKRNSKETRGRATTIDLDNGVFPICEGCRNSRVFPYTLHMHHVKPLSESAHAEDRLLVALCPNCHALVHYLRQYQQGKLRQDVADDLDYWIDSRIEPGTYRRLWAIASENTDALVTKHGLRQKPL